MSGTDPAPTCGNHSAAKSIWYTFTAPTNGTVNAYTLGSNYDTILSAFTGTCGALVQVGCNDDAFLTLQSKLPLAVSGGTTYFFMVSASNGTAGTSQFTLTFEPPPAPTAPFTQVGASTPTPTPTLTITPLPGATNTPTATTAATLTRTPTAPTGNDTCSNAIVIPSAPYVNSANTGTATMDATDPAPGCGNNSREKTVWYRFTAPSNGILMADTLGSDYDTILSAFTGACGAFTGVTGGCNDDAPGSSQSQVSFIATGGTTYFFMISAYTGNGGNLIFHLAFQGVSVTGTQSPTQTPTSTQTFTSIPGATSTPTVTGSPAFAPTATITPTATLTPTATPLAVPNDRCSTAAVVASLPFVSNQTTTAATTEVTDPAPSCGNHSTSKSVWYRFTAPSNGTVTVSTLGSNYDTILAAFTGSCGNLSETRCNDDAPGVAQSQLSFAVTGGTTYSFMVTAYTGNGGNLTFSLSFAP